ncbi:MAG TPA: hypothetical protein VFK94_01625 [Patescibacteria group bacterium]|nr:hypothetical protein [Patescibacteria group bacterium]
MGIFDFLKPTPQGGRLSAEDREKAIQRWRWIEDQVEIGQPNNLKLAIIEADKVLDDALEVFYPGLKHTGERLIAAKEKFPDRQVYDGLWYGHKVRNIIVHETSYDLPSFEAKNIITKYRLGLQQLGLL